MKTKVVLWGENEKEEKVLIGIELIEADNVVRIHTIPEQTATETFYNQMMNQWRNGQELSMPETAAVVDRPLTMTESLLPDELKTDRQDILARAKTEWHFIVLSSKLYHSYADEIQEIKEKVEGLSEYDEKLWGELKGFWSKVQEQVREKNIFREHAGELRARTNQLFDNLKSLRKSMNDEYEKLSRDHMGGFVEKMDDIEKRIEAGLGLHPIFNELKDLQNKFKNTKFTRKHHNDIWNRIDKAFKSVKEKKYGAKSGGGNNSGAVGRLESRFNGLLSAIGKMNSSIGRDRQDEAFQLKRINTTDGQLELQIRQAKMAMIQERIASKQVKLDDMLKTKGELEKRIELEKKKAEAKAAKHAEQAKIKKAKEEIKGEIAKEIESNAEALKEDEIKLTKAAEAIQAVKAKREAVKAKKEAGELETKIPIAAALAIPSAIAPKAVEAVSEASNMDKVEDAFEAGADKGKEVGSNVVEEVKEQAEKAKEHATNVAEEVKEQVENVKESIPTMEEVKEKIEEVKESLPSAAEVVEKAQEINDAIADKAEDLIEKIADSPISEAIEDVKDSVMNKISSLFGSEEE
ncbi:MAG: chromosome segregation ATPase [Saprospiraceae bacterium]|jgi:chromosome segregation ATPase